MSKMVFSLLAVLIISACDSPRNNRVTPNEDSPTTLQTKIFGELSLAVEYQWLKGPAGSIDTENQLLVIIKDDSGTPISLPADFTLSFYSTMPSMGHALDDPGYFENLSEGVYINRHIRYNMAGDWKNELWVMDQDLNIKDKIVWQDFF